MRLVIFGTGQFYEKRKDFFKNNSSNDKIVAFIDNRATSPLSLEGVIVYHPNRIHELVFDKILLMSTRQQEMKAQLLELGISEAKIWSFNYYKCMVLGDKITLYIGKPKSAKKKIAVLSHTLGYHGAPIVAACTVMALCLRGYDAWLVAPEENDTFIQEYKSYGINIAICPSVPCVAEKYLYFFSSFDYIIVNTLPLMPCAVEISKIRPVLWWLHEPNEIYLSTFEAFPKYTNESFERINIVAVSEIAKNNFEECFLHKIDGILPYGIPDDPPWQDYRDDLNPNGEIVFAIIGTVAKIKGQDVFLQAAQKLKNKYGERAAFWIVGFCGDTPYAEDIRQSASETRGVKLLGELTRVELKNVYKAVDVVVCASREETMSMAITEGMMYGKVCITTNKTGMATYIMDGKNGFVCNAESSEALCEKMDYVLLHNEQCRTIRANARKTYEQYFSMEPFSSRLENVLHICN